MSLKTPALSAPYKFLSFKEIDDWFMTQYGSKCSLGEFATGEPFCRVLAKHYSMAVKSSAIKTKPKSEVDRTKNWRLVQQAFKSLEITKDLKFDELMDGRKASNWAFIRWFIQLIEVNKEGEGELSEEWHTPTNGLTPIRSNISVRRFSLTSQRSRLFVAPKRLSLAPSRLNLPNKLPATPVSTRKNIAEKQKDKRIDNEACCACCYCTAKKKPISKEEIKEEIKEAIIQEPISKEEVKPLPVPELNPSFTDRVAVFESEEVKKEKPCKYKMPRDSLEMPSANGKPRWETAGLWAFSQKKK